MGCGMSLTEYSITHLPIYPEFEAITTAHEVKHWLPSEVNLSNDVEQWKSGKATPEEKSLISNILRLFTTSDVAVGQGYYDKLIPVIKNNEARMMLGSFANRERIHVLAYALLSDTLGFGEDFYFEFLEYAEMAEKYEYMIEPIGNSMSEFGKYLAKQTLIEGVNLFASFAILLNFDRYGMFPGMVDVVRWSIRDEDDHVQGNSLLFKKWIEEHPRIVNDEFKKDIYRSARKLVELEDAFVDKAFELGDVRGLTPEDIKQYIRYTTDNRLVQLGFKPNWEIEKNPLPWIEGLLVDGMASFFERSVTEYQKDNFTGEWVYPE